MRELFGTGTATSPEHRACGLFVTGTGTGVGKTILSAALLAAMKAAGERVGAHKPVVTGLDDAPGQWPPDHELLALAAGMNPEDVAPLRFGAAVSPHLASALTDDELDSDELLDNTSRAASQTDILIVEGVGGLLVPLNEHFTIRDLAVKLNLPLVVAASPELGTINHTLLTLEAARAVGLSVAAVVLTPWPTTPSRMESSNRDTIASLGQVEVAALPWVASPDFRQLALSGAELPWQRWLRAPRDTQ